MKVRVEEKEVSYGYVNISGDASGRQYRTDWLRCVAGLKKIGERCVGNSLES